MGGAAMKRIVIAGAAIAGLSAARGLRKAGFDGRIQLVDQEPTSPYRRPEVSKGILEGRVDETSIKVPWPDDLDLELVPASLRHVDFGAGTVIADHDGATITLPYDGLVLATGSLARLAPFRPLGNVFSLRSLDDGLRMRQALVGAQRLVLVGGGFIGLEVAAVARKLGLDVTVVEAAEVPLRHALGRTFGDHIAAVHRDRGVRILCGHTVAGVHGDATVEAVSLADGTRLPADVVLVSIGSTPATNWLTSSGLDTTRGVLCDRTCAPRGLADVVAAGDVATWHNPLYERHMRVEHWTNAIEQGTYAAQRLLGTHDPKGFVSAPYFWSDQYGMRLQSVGSTAGYDQIEILARDSERLLVAYGRQGRLICVAGLHAGRAVMSYRRLVLDRATMDAARTQANETVEVIRA